MAKIDRRALLALAAAGGVATLGAAVGDEREERRGMIYLDNAATSFPKPEPVYRAIESMLRNELANPWQGPFRMSAASLKAVEDTRKALNQLFRGEGPERWAHTFNGTDSLNMAIKGVLRKGDHVITSDLEHDSVTRPLDRLEKEGVITQDRVASHDGFIDPDDVRKALKGRKKAALVAITHASNLTGTIQPIEEIAPLVREGGALLLVDAAQSAGQVPLDLRRTPIDLLALSAHKNLFGPTGTGALYVGLRAEPGPWREGDTGGKGNETKTFHPEDLPHRLEGGTPNVLGIAGLKAGLAWVAEQGPDAIRRQVVGRLRPVVDWAEQAGWRVVGRWSEDRCIGVLSLVPRRLKPKTVGERLDREYDIATRPGIHEVLYGTKATGTFPDGTLRISPGPFTTEDQIATLIDALQAIAGGKG